MTTMTLNDAMRDSFASRAQGIANQSEAAIRDRFGEQDYFFRIAADRYRKQCDFMGLSDSVRLSLVEDGRASMFKANPHTESPIEKLLLPFLIFQDYGLAAAKPAVVHIPSKEDEAPAGNPIIVPQFAFVRFRVDFAVVIRVRGNAKIVAVECDGNEYHNPSRDAARDRYLASWGIPTIRASGAEIKRAPHVVSERVAHVLIEWQDKQKRGDNG